MNMTENETLKSALEKVKAQKVNFGFMERFDVDENWEVMKALEEIPRYRDLGTIDELAEMQVQYYHLLHQVKEFEKIGTIDELKALKEKSVAKKPTCVSMAKDKDTAVGSIGRCPCCNYIVAEDMLWCDDCGQKLDWQ